MCFGASFAAGRERKEFPAILDKWLIYAKIDYIHA